MTQSRVSVCPLCASMHSEFYFEDKKRCYMQCSQCQLVFVPKEQRLDTKTEKAHYDMHENNPQDQGYRNFLSRLATPLIERLAPHSKGLDFGCGPGPTLSLILEEAGHNMSVYDIYYQPDTRPLEDIYDFMTSTEVIEHLYDPQRIWQQWLCLVKDGGWIGLMTKLVIDKAAFSTWHYKNDLTHVCFYSKETFNYLAKRDNLEIEFIGNDVILLKKKNTLASVNSK